MADVSATNPQDSSCPVTRGEVDLNWYHERDGFWREVGLAAPARRALINANINNLADLRKTNLTEIAQLHGIGKNALLTLESLLISKA